MMASGMVRDSAREKGGGNQDGIAGTILTRQHRTVRRNSNQNQTDSWKDYGIDHYGMNQQLGSHSKHGNKHNDYRGNIKTVRHSINIVPVRNGANHFPPAPQLLTDYVQKTTNNNNSHAARQGSRRYTQLRRGSHLGRSGQQTPIMGDNNIQTNGTIMRPNSSQRRSQNESLHSDRMFDMLTDRMSSRKREIPRYYSPNGYSIPRLTQPQNYDALMGTNHSFKRSTSSSLQKINDGSLYRQSFNSNIAGIEREEAVTQTSRSENKTQQRLILDSKKLMREPVTQHLSLYLKDLHKQLHNLKYQANEQADEQQWIDGQASPLKDGIVSSIKSPYMHPTNSLPIANITDSKDMHNPIDLSVSPSQSMLEMSESMPPQTPTFPFDYVGESFEIFRKPSSMKGKDLGAPDEKKLALPPLLEFRPSISSHKSQTSSKKAIQSTNKPIFNFLSTQIGKIKEIRTEQLSNLVQFQQPIIQDLTSIHRSIVSVSINHQSSMSQLQGLMSEMKERWRRHVEIERGNRKAEERQIQARVREMWVKIGWREEQLTHEIG